MQATRSVTFPAWLPGSDRTRIHGDLVAALAGAVLLAPRTAALVVIAPPLALETCAGGIPPVFRECARRPAAGGASAPGLAQE